MANRSLSESLSIVQSLKPSTLTTNNTTVAGTGVDLLGYDAASIHISAGVWGDTTTGGFEIGLQHSDASGSGYVDVPNAELSFTVTGDNTTSGSQVTGVVAKIDSATEDDAVYTADYLGAKRYIRYKVSAEGNQSTGTAFAINIVRGRPAFAPTGANLSA